MGQRYYHLCFGSEILSIHSLTSQGWAPELAVGLQLLLLQRTQLLNSPSVFFKMNLNRTEAMLNSLANPCEELTLADSRQQLHLLGSNFRPFHYALTAAHSNKWVKQTRTRIS